MMRAKVVVNSVHSFESSENLEMSAVYKSGGYEDSKGADEDNTFALYTPSAKFEMTINNPELLGKIKAGKKFYVDFTEVPGQGESNG